MRVQTRLSLFLQTIQPLPVRPSTQTDSIFGYKWVKISGPLGGAPSLENSAATIVSNLTAGTYVYEFIVTDNNGAIARDTTIVTVNPAGNQSPVAEAGADIIVILPTNYSTLTGAGTDVDGTIQAYSWSQLVQVLSVPVLLPPRLLPPLLITCRLVYTNFNLRLGTMGVQFQKILLRLL